jgi:hypothetical protein
MQLLWLVATEQQRSTLLPLWTEEAVTCGTCVVGAQILVSGALQTFNLTFGKKKHSGSVANNVGEKLSLSTSISSMENTCFSKKWIKITSRGFIHKLLDKV